MKPQTTRRGAKHSLAPETPAKYKCEFCTTMLEINWKEVHHHWYEGISGIYYYNYYYADINDIVVCFRCAKKLKQTNIVIPEHIPQKQWYTWAVEYLRKQHEI